MRAVKGAGGEGRAGEREATDSGTHPAYASGPGDGDGGTVSRSWETSVILMHGSTGHVFLELMRATMERLAVTCRGRMRRMLATARTAVYVSTGRERGETKAAGALGE